MKRIAESSVRRLALYLRYLEDFELRGQSTISSEALAKCGGTTSAQVRKDLSFFGSFGTRGLGYAVPELAAKLREILGIGRDWRVVIVGAGKIGAALAQYRGMRQHGFRLVGIFDADPGRAGRKLAGVTVHGMADFDTELRALAAHIAIITVPADAAQDIADRVVAAGVRAILNFAPTGLQVRDDVAVRNVNTALELEVLSYALMHVGEEHAAAEPEDD